MKHQIILEEKDVADIIKKHMKASRNLDVKTVTIDVRQMYDQMDRPIGYGLQNITLELE